MVWYGSQIASPAAQSQAGQARNLLPQPPRPGLRVEEGSGFRVQGSEFRAEGLGFKIQGLGFQDVELKLSRLELRSEGLGFIGVRVSG
eukprot:3771448-Rhodomonas_salina.4